MCENVPHICALAGRARGAAARRRARGRQRAAIKLLFIYVYALPVRGAAGSTARCRILRPVSLALPGAPVLYSLPFSPPPTRHAVGDATRPHRVTRIDLISSFIPRIAHSSLRSERRLRRACGCAAGRPTTQELLEERCRSRFWRPVHLHIAGQLCACSAPLVQNDLVDQLLPLPPVRCEREAQSWPYVK